MRKRNGVIYVVTDIHQDNPRNFLFQSQYIILRSYKGTFELASYFDDLFRIQLGEWICETRRYTIKWEMGLPFSILLHIFSLRRWLLADTSLLRIPRCRLVITSRTTRSELGERMGARDTRSTWQKNVRYPRTHTVITGPRSLCLFPAQAL